VSNWLANATGIHISPSRSYIDRNQVGNMLKNVSPIAGALTGGLGGILLGGAGSALGRGVQEGSNFGNILGQGVSGAGLSAVGSQGLGALRGAFSGGGPATAGAGGVGGGVPSPTGIAPGMGMEPGQAIANVGNVAPAGSAGPGLPAPGMLGSGAGNGVRSLAPLTQGVGGVPSAISGGPGPGGLARLAHGLGAGARAVGGFAKDNPTAIGAGLQGIGHLASVGPENRLTNATAAQREYDLQIQRQRDIALEPLRRALAGNIGGQLALPSQPVARNPYQPGG
jgi:hypothetical protein